MKQTGSDAENAGIIAMVTELAEPLLAEKGLELVEVQFRLESGGRVLRLIIERPTGTAIDDCVAVSREIGHILEVEDLIQYSYHLEVSSPGLDRPLKQEKDFVRAVGKKAKITSGEPAATLIGRIKQVEGGQVTLSTDSAEVLIPLESVHKARLVVEF